MIVVNAHYLSLNIINVIVFGDVVIAFIVAIMKLRRCSSTINWLMIRKMKK